MIDKQGTPASLVGEREGSGALHETLRASSESPDVLSIPGGGCTVPEPEALGDVWCYLFDIVSRRRGLEATCDSGPSHPEQDQWPTAW